MHEYWRLSIEKEQRVRQRNCNVVSDYFTVDAGAMPAEVSAVSKSKEVEPSPGKTGETGEVGGGGGGRGEAERAEETGRLLIEFAEHTSLPGVPRVIQAPNRWSQLFWVVVCLACAIAFFVGLSDLLKRYFAYDKKVSLLR